MIRERGITLLGISLTNLCDADAVQLALPLDRRRPAALDTAVDGVRERFGKEAITRAVQAFEETRRLPSWRRAAILEGISSLLAARSDELTRVIALEAGKPIREGEVEVDRGVFTIRTAAEEAKRIEGEVISSRRGELSVLADEWKIVGAVRGSIEDFVQVAYMDPDGSPRYCANSEIGDLAAEVYRRTGNMWVHDGSLTARGTAHLEFGAQQPFAELPVSF